MAFELKNDRLIKALLREPVDITPVWIMRQAGRYLPEYRAIRKKTGDFLKLCKTPELACEVTLQPIARYPLDAAIIFSDILMVPYALGQSVKFIKNFGPHLGLLNLKEVKNYSSKNFEVRSESEGFQKEKMEKNEDFSGETSENDEKMETRMI